MPSTEISPTISDPVGECFGWVIAGHSEADIRQALATKFPQVDHGQVMTAVMVRIRQASESEPEVMIGWSIEATRELYCKMVGIGDFAGALRAVKQMVELTKYVGGDERDQPKEIETNEMSDL